jgi:hypothetical protein
MEKRDLDLIEKYILVDGQLKEQVEEHKRFEAILEDFKKRIHLTAEEEVEQKRIKKLKLKGRDRIEQLLAKYRNQVTD